MMRLYFSAVLALLFQRQLQGNEVTPAAEIDPLAYVNILQGTDSHFELSHGNTLPLVGMPWGMVDWSIENGTGDWFFQPNGKIDGFRATRQPAPWMSDYGQFTLMPQVGDLQLDAASRMSEYDASSSILRPDYERLELKKGEITSELTATERGAVFRFTFHSGKSGRLIINTSGGSEVKIVGRTISGLCRMNNGGVAGNFASYFVIMLDREISRNAIFANNVAMGGSEEKGDNLAACVEFSVSPDSPVECRIGTSLIGWDQAERNLKVETGGGFDVVHARVAKTWNSNLRRIEIVADEDQKRTFYSCLYRAQMFPHRLYELDPSGKALHYSPYDGEIHSGVLYGDIGIWDAFRTTFPLITILYPEQLSEILQGFVNASEEGGTLPEWPSPGYRDGMIGQHCAAIFADALIKGYRDYDVAKAYESLRKSAFQPPGKGELIRRGLADYLRLGYIPDGSSKYAVSASLDYAYDDWCIAQMARQLNRIEDYKVLVARAKNYRLLWDPIVGFMRPKDAGGRWAEAFDQFSWGGPYAEGGPWQSSWFVPHDPAGLAGLLGGREKLAEKLDEMMGLPPVFHLGGYGHVIHEMTEMAVARFGQYAHSNQPVFHVLYLYAAAGQPWKTEYWTRRICSELYNSGPQGFAGDEDNGSMASWYLLSSIGFYPFCPGTPDYILTSPLFTKITLHLPQEKTFIITASSNSERNVFVQRRRLNGADDDRTWITHRDIIQGGRLDMDMGLAANMRPVQEKDLPYSLSTEEEAK